MTNKQVKTTKSALEMALAQALAQEQTQEKVKEVDTSAQDVNDYLYRAAVFATYYLTRKGKQSLYDNSELSSLLLNAVKMSKIEQAEFMRILDNIYQTFDVLTTNGIIPKRTTAYDLIKSYAEKNGKSLAKSAWTLYKEEKQITYADYREVMDSLD